MNLPLHKELPKLEVHYDTVVLPALTALEPQRKFRVKLAYVCVTAIALGGVISSYIWAYYAEPKVWLAGLMLTGLLMALTWKYMLLEVLRQAKHICVRGLLEGCLGWSYTDTGHEPKVFETLNAFGLFANFTSKVFSDYIRGGALGRAFDLVEIKLTIQEGKSTRRVFQGALIGIDMSTHLRAVTIARSKGQGRIKSESHLKHVGLISPNFNARFDVFSTDQVEARVLLTPTFILQLHELEAAFEGKNLQFAFMQGRAFIVLETHDHFEITSLSKSLLDRSRFERLRSEINAIYHLAGGLNAKTPEQWRDDFGAG